MRIRELATAILLVCCRSPEPTAPAAVTRDDPATCLGPSKGDAKPSPEQDALMAGIAGLGECAASLEKPSAVLARVDFRADGTVERVAVVRASTENCQAIDCVRRHLARLKVPPAAEDDRSAGAAFVLRREPPPDGYENVRWEEGSESDRCTDPPPPPAYELGISREDLDRPFLARKDRLRACYRSGLARDNTLGGRVVVQVTISRSGNVARVSVSENQLADCKVVACIVDEIQTLKFPRPKIAFAVDYPLDFRPKDSAPSAPPAE